MVKVKSLTEAQIAKFGDYLKEGVEIGLATEDNPNAFPEALVRELTDKHRVSCGLKPATYFFVEQSPFTALSKYKGLTSGNALYGQHDISWLIFYKFFRVESGLVKETEKIVHLLELAKYVGWMWMSSNATIVTLRPKILRMRNTATLLGNTSLNLRVLHNEEGYALEYHDGTGVYALNGLRIPKEYTWTVTTPAEQLKLKDVMGIKNTEIRTEVIKKLGIERAFSSLSTKRLDEETIRIPARLTEVWASEANSWVPSITAESSSDYKLFSVNVGEEQRIYLTSTCPSSGKPFYEAVHPNCQTVRAALRWREFGDFGDYTPPLVRT